MPGSVWIQLIEPDADGATCSLTNGDVFVTDGMFWDGRLLEVHH